MLKMHIYLYSVAVLLINRVSSRKLTKHTAFPVTSPCHDKNKLVLHRLNVKLRQQEIIDLQQK